MHFVSGLCQNRTDDVKEMLNPEELEMLAKIEMQNQYDLVHCKCFLFSNIK